MFCIALNPNNYGFIKDLGYVPVGVGEKDFDNRWFTDKSGINIAEKNKYYSECINALGSIEASDFCRF